MSKLNSKIFKSKMSESSNDVEEITSERMKMENVVQQCLEVVLYLCYFESLFFILERLRINPLKGSRERAEERMERIN